MITYGFFNSVNGDRTYNADDMSNYFEGIISDGVFSNVGQAFKVSSNSNMTVKVGSGKGIIKNKYVNSTASETLNIETAHATLSRYDAVVLKCNLSTRQITLEVKTGTPLATPIKPTMEDTAYIKEYCLAYITVSAGATSITSANIEDTRADTSLCGFVQPLIGNTIKKYQSYKTISSDTSTVTIGIPQFDSSVDTLLVYENGLLLNETEEYLVGGTGSTAFVDLATPIEAGNSMTFIVFKSETI